MSKAFSAIICCRRL